MTVSVVIGLGSNLNRPLLQLREACRRLQQHTTVSIVAYSDIYESKAVVPEQSPASWRDKDYLNAAVRIETTLTPHELLRILKKIEHAMGRREGETWAPRVIDLDILIFGDVILQDDALQIPHRHLHERAFAIMPLCDVMPNNQYPRLVSSDIKKIPHLLNGPQIVGILNITPDSFSDGNQFIDPDSAVTHAQQLYDDGADVIDVGAESTRPGHDPVDSDLEWQRLQPVLERIHAHWYGKEHRPLISIDTRHVKTVERALDYGIDWINDQRQESFDQMAPMIKARQLHYVAMHHETVTRDVIDALKQYEEKWLTCFSKHDIHPSQLIVDPGIGFGKTHEQHLKIFNSMRELHQSGAAYLVGHSRKSFLNTLLHHPSVMSKEMATAFISAALASSGVDYLRVHAPKINLEAIRIGRVL